MNSGTIDVSGMQTMMTVIGYGFGLFVALVLAVILVLNRRNMDGWDLPVSYVWFAMSGRINRKTYWLTGIIGVFLVEIMYELVVNGMLLAASTMLPLNEAILFIAMLVTLVPFMVFSIWTGLALNFKRIHDRGRSAWFLLIGLIPLIGALWLLIELGFLRGTVGDNKFGPEHPDVAGGTSRQQKAARRSNMDVDETPSRNLSELPNRDMIAARVGDDFMGPESPEPSEP
mgnify:FL=1